MGAWDTGIFDNDDAADWLIRLDDDGDGAIDDALAAVLDAGPGYLERDVGASALAAAEVVAALRGQPSPGVPPEVTSWVADHPRTPDQQRLERARRAVDLVANVQSSEVAELWDGAHGADWQRILNDLRTRLS